VTCEPTTARNHTLWSFHCDGATYPARLVNLPCPIELHKTHDHAAYYKSCDVAQMLIIYEDDMALEEAENEKPVEGFPSYYHSGITPPMRRVVERRFAAREQKTVAPPRSAVSDVEDELTELMENLAKDEKNKRKNKLPTLTAVTKVLEEVTEEIVDYEPWMDDYGRQPHGVEFDADDQLASLHPEVWLSRAEIEQVRNDDLEARKQKQAELDMKEQKAKQRKENKKKKKEAAAAAAAESTTKKGKKKKQDQIVDDIEQVAASMLTGEGGTDLMGDVLDDDDFFNDFDFAGEDLNFDL